ncbi:MAG: cadmium-translocating P-type ATPase [Candidatus Altiarchaeota archaeon]|nr:cadmium-translocating P-type ATPase [Candidatus Altiarchaeota archaeon]
MAKYQCPKCGMRYDKPGKCTMDGATLVKVGGDVSHNHPSEQKKHNHSDHHKHMAENFKKRFIVSMLVTLPILFLSPLIQQVLGISFRVAGDKFILWTLSSFIFFYGGWPFLKGIFEELKKRQPGMMTLIALAISVAYIYSSAVVFGLEGKFFFWELATLIDIMLLGHWIEMKSILGASRALEKLAQLLPDTAHLIKDGKITDVKISEIKSGDLILIKAGEKIPADGIIMDGSSYLDESMLTGESKPVKKGAGDQVIGGAINGVSILEIKVTGTGEASYLNKVIKLVKDAQASKSKTQRLADRAAKWLTVIAITAGATTLVYWMRYGPSLAFAIERMATVMVIACPHALGLAIPLVSAVSTSLSAKNGLLIRNRTAFENSRKITTVVFDKTGTLTEGNFGVNSIVIFDKTYSEKKVIELATALEQNSEHPIARGIIKKAEQLGVKNSRVVNFKVLKGEGIEGKIRGKIIKLVSQKHLIRNKIKVPKSTVDEVGTLVYLLVNNLVVGVITLADEIREESFEAVKQLQNLGIKCWMLTGDNQKTSKAVSDKLNLDGYFAEVLPHEKLEKIKELQNNKEFVAMTGDGINDAPALAQADVGIAIGSGTDVAAETADIILVNSNPKDVTSLILFGKATHTKIIQNLFWATGYNVVAIPLAAGVLYNMGILISPAIGAALMSLSTVIVAVNARLLKVKR